MSEVIIEIENLKKQYRLGTIGGGTLTADIQSWWAKLRKKEDPNLKIGQEYAKRGEKFWALNGINLQVRKGEALGIIGHNGAGKSTLLKILSRVTAPTDGTVKMRGRVSSMLEVGTGFHQELTGRENIYLNGAILGMSKKEINSKIDEIIEFSECSQFIDTPVKRYSSGMYVKLAFAVAAYLDAEILIMDEVLAVGDIKFQEKCLGKMGDAANSEGKTVLYVSHNMSTIRQLCSRCIVLDHGEIIYDGDVETAIEIYAEREKGDMVNYYCLDNVKRPSLDHGANLFIHDFEFLEKETPEYKPDEKIHFRITYSANLNISNIGIYYTIVYSDSTVVGTIQSPIFDDIRAGESKSCDFYMSVPELVAGDYYFYIDIFSLKANGGPFSLDHPLKKIYFKILEDSSRKGIDWQRRYFGSIRFDTLKLGNVRLN